jgi:putrescine---pyruvate transaminase
VRVRPALALHGLASRGVSLKPWHRARNRSSGSDRCGPSASRSRPGNPFRTGPTYAGHPACCAAALANLEIIEREGLLDRARELEARFKELLDTLLSHELVSEVRAGLGVMAGIEIAAEARAAGVSVADVFQATRERGVLVRPLATSLGLSPPLLIGEEELALIPEAIGAALDAVHAVAG